MTPEAQVALTSLYRKHDFSKLEQDFAAAIQTITNSVADINDRLVLRRDNIERQKTRRRKNAQNAGDDEDELESAQQEEETQASLQAFKEKIEGMTKRMDHSVRKIIDGQQELMHTKGALEDAAAYARQNASTQAATQTRRTQEQSDRELDQDGDEDMGDDTVTPQGTEYPDIDPTDPGTATQNITGPSIYFKDRAAEWSQRYQDRPLVDRYGAHKEYMDFRTILHGAQFPDDSVDLPPAERWFDEGALARPGMTQRVEDDDDEDIQISRATTSTKCPITLREFVEPLTSRKCAHTFEAQPIREMIRSSQSRLGGKPGRGGTITGGRPAVRCPVASCSQMLEEVDLYTDVPIVRKIRRLQQRDQELAAEERHDHEVIDDDDDDDGPEIDELERDDVVSSIRPVKREAVSSSRR
ncbi:hypothetical protein AMS68_007088 [Peltaster fructicola]|uniref:SP-RING-type domain-containing protein n=1 Tax=Peltaster fructicola TaxID=286661 RepID=A0A6H0Y3S4_9PEZI|nr:hypothetical protein AMS68_007088 [Peltaster fructicola]